MNKTEMDLIRNVCENNLYGAKKYVRSILQDSKSKVDPYFRNEMLSLLDNQSEMEELPSTVRGFLIIENQMETFKSGRYYLSNREKETANKIVKMSIVAQELAKIGVKYVNSTMLYGESGTGKTTFGKYIAYCLGIPFAYLDFSRIIDSKLGATSKNISQIFDYIRQYKCVLMIDEIDAIGLRRGDAKEVGELSRIVITLMQNFDTLTNNTVVIGATNRIGDIDEALLRRFNIKHEVKRPADKKERSEMAIKFFNDVNFPITDPELKRLILESDKDTQADFMNRMITILADHFAADLD